MIDSISLGSLNLDVEYSPFIEDGGIGGTYYGSAYYFDSFPELQDIEVDRVWIDNRKVELINERNIIRIKHAVGEQICVHDMIRTLQEEAI